MDRPVDAGATGTIVRALPGMPSEEPTYVVELAPPRIAPSFATARHEELQLLKPFVPAKGTPILSAILLVGAGLSALASLLSIFYCKDLFRTSSGWGAVAFVFVIAPFLILLPLALVLIPSAILYKRGRRRIDLVSLLLSGATVAVTIIEVVVLMNADFHGC